MTSRTYPRNVRLVQHSKTNQCIIIYCSSRIKNKNYIIISIVLENTLDKLQHSFIIKTLSQPGREESSLNLIKGIYKTPTANIVLKGERLKTFSLRSGTQQECLILALLFDIISEVLDRTIRQD